MDVGGVVGKHVGGGYQLYRTRDIAPLYGARVKSHMAFAAIRHGRRHFRTLVALGECAGEGRHDGLGRMFSSHNTESRVCAPVLGVVCRFWTGFGRPSSLFFGFGIPIAIFAIESDELSRVESRSRMRSERGMEITARIVRYQNPFFGEFNRTVEFAVSGTDSRMNVAGLASDILRSKSGQGKPKPLLRGGSPGPIGNEWGRTTRTRSQGGRV